MAHSDLLRITSMAADSSIGIFTGVPGTPGYDATAHRQYRFVKVVGATGDQTTAGLAVTAGGAVVDGVLQNRPQHVGDEAAVAISGITLLLAGIGGVVAGSPVKSDATGKGVIGTPGTDAILARATTAASAGQLFSALLKLGS